MNGEKTLDEIVNIKITDIEELSNIREKLYKEKLIGEKVLDGKKVNYGSISKLLPPYDAPKNRKRFLISGSETGGLKQLKEENYTLVFECNPEEGSEIQSGAIGASPEIMTHGTLYNFDERIRFILEGHCPLTWKNATRLDIPITNNGMKYGTPEMVGEIERILKRVGIGDLNIFAIGSYKDKIFTFGESSTAALSTMFYYLLAAKELTNY